MKKLIKSLSLALIALSISASTFAVSNKIVGDIGFTGVPAFDATGVSFPTAVTTGSTTGDYSPIAGNTAVSFTSFNFADTSVAPLWTLTYNAITYSFTANTLTSDYVSIPGVLSFFTVYGSGMASITGYEDTYGTYVISGNNASQNFTFSASTSVPDGGATASLLGLSLVGFAFAARRFKKA